MFSILAEISEIIGNFMRSNRSIFILVADLSCDLKSYGEKRSQTHDF